MKLTPALLTLFFGTQAVVAGLKPAPKILLSRIDFLTLRNGQMTKSRRVEPIPQVSIYLRLPPAFRSRKKMTDGALPMQLKCVGGDGQGRYEVDVMRCKNQGRSVAPVPAQVADLLMGGQRLRRRGHQLGLHGQSAGRVQARGNGRYLRGVRALAGPP